jgi:hypothetical protein
MARATTAYQGGLARVLRPAQVIAIGAILILASCSGFPEVAALEGPPAPPPPLLPLDGVLPALPDKADPAPALTARADALRARAGTVGAP